VKKRRLIISLFLLVALISIGVGYAELTNSLLVETDISANINNGNLKVEFVEVTNTLETDPITVSVLGPQKVNVGFNNTNTMSAKGDSQSIELKVRNNSLNAVGTELDATLSTLEIVSNSITKDETASTDTRVVYKGTHFTVVAEWVTANDLLLEAARPDASIPAGENILKITISLNVTVTSEIPQHAFTVKFTAKTA
jgi:hypothetical protein